MNDALLIYEFIRIRPYSPSFSRIAARTIDPDTGASTWAFGKHRCTENIGTLTKKAVINIAHIILLFM